MEDNFDYTGGGPAFPSPIAFHASDDDIHSSDDGMTQRDYFAAKAMQGMVAAGGSWPDANTRPEIALRAYLMADAMLKARDA